MALIAHFSQDFAHGKAQLGGFSRILNLTRDRHEHVIFTLHVGGHAIETFQVDHLDVVAVPVSRAATSRVRQVATIRSVGDAVAAYCRRVRLRPDVLFGHSQLFNYFVLRRARNRLSRDIPLVWEVNAVWGLGGSHGAKQAVVQAINRALLAFILRDADAAVCQTAAARRLLIERLGAPPDKLAVVTNGVDLEAVSTTGPRAAHHRFRVACIGLFDEMNGIPFLIEMLKRGSIPNIDVTFIGDGKYRARVEELAAAGRCAYGGTLPNREMLRVLVSFDALVIPRLCRLDADLFIPTKLLEAMALGVVPVCSDVAAMQDVVRDGVHGLLFRAGDPESLRDAFAKLVAMPPEERQQLAENARARIAADYEWRKLHHILDHVYKRAIANGRG